MLPGVFLVCLVFLVVGAYCSFFLLHLVVVGNILSLNLWCCLFGVASCCFCLLVVGFLVLVFLVCGAFLVAGCLCYFVRVVGLLVSWCICCCDRCVLLMLVLLIIGVVC